MSAFSERSTLSVAASSTPINRWVNSKDFAAREVLQQQT
jgi:hypothetical protein